MQKEEAASNPEYGTTFKDALTKDEKKARRKAILANIGAARCRSVWRVQATDAGANS